MLQTHWCLNVNLNPKQDIFPTKTNWDVKMFSLQNHRVHVRSTHFQEGAGPVPVTRLLWFHIFSREVFSLCLTSWRGSAGWLAGVDQPSDHTALRPHARGRGHKFTSPPSSFCKAQPPLPMISESFLLSFIVPHALRSSSSHHLWSAHQHQIFHPPFSGGGFLPLYLASLCLRMLLSLHHPSRRTPPPVMLKLRL